MINMYNVFAVYVYNVSTYINELAYTCLCMCDIHVKYIFAYSYIHVFVHIWSLYIHLHLYIVCVFCIYVKHWKHNIYARIYMVIYMTTHPHIDALYFSVYTVYINIYIRCLVSFAVHAYEHLKTGKHVELIVFFLRYIIIHYPSKLSNDWILN